MLASAISRFPEERPDRPRPLVESLVIMKVYPRRRLLMRCPLLFSFSAAFCGRLF